MLRSCCRKALLLHPKGTTTRISAHPPKRAVDRIIYRSLCQSTTSTSVAGSGTIASRWERIRSSPYTRWLQRALRFGRVAFLVISIYAIGVQSGIMQFANFPQETEAEMLLSTLPAGTTPEQIEKMNKLKSSREYKRLHRVMDNILNSARNTIDHRLQEIDATTNAQEYEIFVKAKRKLSGDWQLVMFPADEVNAYVSGVCPKKIFVLTGLLKALHPTDDELAVIIGHEISHIILSHNESNADFTAFLLALQLLVFSLVDPLGVSTIAFDFITDFLRKLIAASYSRHNENEADALGIEIAANACYDVVHGIGIMQKLALVAQRIPVTHSQYPDSSGTHVNPDTTMKDSTVILARTKNPTFWLDTHPSSDDRYDILQKKVHDMIKAYPGNDPTPDFPKQKPRYMKPPHCTVVTDLYRSYASMSDVVWYKSKLP